MITEDMKIALENPVARRIVAAMMNHTLPLRNGYRPFSVTPTRISAQGGPDPAGLKKGVPKAMDLLYSADITKVDREGTIINGFKDEDLLLPLADYLTRRYPSENLVQILKNQLLLMEVEECNLETYGDYIASQHDLPFYSEKDGLDKAFENSGERKIIYFESEKAVSDCGIEFLMMVEGKKLFGMASTPYHVDEGIKTNHWFRFMTPYKLGVSSVFVDTPKYFQSKPLKEMESEITGLFDIPGWHVIDTLADKIDIEPEKLEFRLQNLYK